MLVHQWCFSQSWYHRHWLQPIRCRCLAIGQHVVQRCYCFKFRRKAVATTPPSKVLLYKTELVPPTAMAIALVKTFLAIGQHVGSSVVTRLRSRRVVLNKPPSKTLNYTQGAEEHWPYNPANRGYILVHKPNSHSPSTQVFTSLCLHYPPGPGIFPYPPLELSYRGPQAHTSGKGVSNAP